MSTSRDILNAIHDLRDKVAQFERASRMPHIPPSTMATALLLTGITRRSAISEALGVSIQALRVSPVYAAFRSVEGNIRSGSAVSRRSKSRDEFVDGDDEC